MTSPVQLYPERRHRSQLTQYVAHCNSWALRYLLKTQGLPVLDHNWTLQIKTQFHIIQAKITTEPYRSKHSFILYKLRSQLNLTDQNTVSYYTS